MIHLPQSYHYGVWHYYCLPRSLFSMPEHGLTKPDVAIFADLPGKSWMNFPVEAMAMGI